MLERAMHIGAQWCPWQADTKFNSKIRGAGSLTALLSLFSSSLLLLLSGQWIYSWKLHLHQLQHLWRMCGWIIVKSFVIYAKRVAQGKRKLIKKVTGKYDVIRHHVAVAMAASDDGFFLLYRSADYCSIVLQMVTIEMSSKLAPKWRHDACFV